MRIALVNAAGALAVVGVSGGFAPGVSWGDLARGFGVSMIYANTIGTLLAMLMPLIAKRCWGADHGTRWAVLISGMMVVTVAGILLANTLLYWVGYIPRGQFWRWLSGGIGTALVVSLILGVAVTSYETLRSQLDDATVALRTKERDEAQARRIAAEAQLASIESRVQPHFLFNTLNSIAALVHDDPAGAERMTGQLASLLRSALDSTATPLVPLDQELRVVRAYLDIERVRFGDRLRYDVDLGEGTASAIVPRMALQTLVENSVKYAVSPRREGGSICVRATASNGRVRVTVEDDGPGFDPAHRPEGHGLALLDARLAMLFGDRASMRVDSRAGTRTSRWRESRNLKITPMRAYIVDDERLAVQRLTRLLEATKRVEVIGGATDPEAALEFLRANAVDVLFLDIQMPGLTGFELLERLDRDVLVIFTTAYDRYAVDAFAVNSVDYLLKPIETEAARSRARQAGALCRAGARPDIRALARELAAELAPNRRLERIASRVGERTTVLDVARISHFSSKDKLTFGVVNGHEHVVDYTLTELEARLDARRFARIHRATIVNIAFVQELYPGIDGVLVRLKDEQKTELSVARDRVRELKERLGI